MKIKLFCEGNTEKGLEKLLRNAIPECGFKVKPHNGVADLLRGIENKVAVELKKGAEVVYLLVDLYHYPIENLESYPIEKKESDTRPTRKQLVEKDISDKLKTSINSVKVFVIIHEIETWILADSDVIRKRLKSYQPEPYSNLEKDGKYSHPAKFLNILFKTHHPKKYSYEKKDDGSFLLEQADWKKIYDSCKVFRELIDSLREDCK